MNMFQISRPFGKPFRNHHENLMNTNPALRRLSVSVLVGFLLWPGSAFPENTSAPLLTTITNPSPAAYDIFGSAVAAIGNDRVLVGAEGAAEAYLYSLEGNLLTTFTIPDPA